VGKYKPKRQKRKIAEAIKRLGKNHPTTKRRIQRRRKND